jgi:hypothetical protein
VHVYVSLTFARAAFLLTDTARAFFCVAAAWGTKMSAEDDSKTNRQQHGGRKKGGTNSGERAFRVGHSIPKHKEWLTEVMKTDFSMEKLKVSLRKLASSMQHPQEAKGQNARSVLEWLNTESGGKLSRVCCQEASSSSIRWILVLKTTMGWAGAS